jgi:hypothetical protein
VANVANLTLRKQPAVFSYYTSFKVTSCDKMLWSGQVVLNCIKIAALHHKSIVLCHGWNTMLKEAERQMIRIL